MPNSSGLRRLQLSKAELVYAVWRLIDDQSPYNAGHSLEVAQLSIAIAVELGAPQEVVESVGIAGLLHDVGMVKISNEILDRPGGLTIAEEALLVTHPQDGFEMLMRLGLPAACLKGVLEHHERFNGSGYPNQLKGENISLEGRIIGVVETVVAMQLNDAYRTPPGLEAALAEIEKNAGILYDPRVVASYLRIYGENDLAHHLQPQQPRGRATKDQVMGLLASFAWSSEHALDPRVVVDDQFLLLQDLDERIGPRVLLPLDWKAIKGHLLVGEQALETTLWNVSDQGAALMLPAAATVAAHTFGTLTIIDPSSRQAQSSEVEVRWCETGADASFCGIQLLAGQWPEGGVVHRWLRASDPGAARGEAGLTSPRGAGAAASPDSPAGSPSG
jgi:putative nucleotidyltransferase with HDIG domain